MPPQNLSVNSHIKQQFAALPREESHDVVPVSREGLVEAFTEAVGSGQKSLSHGWSPQETLELQGQEIGRKMLSQDENSHYYPKQIH